MVASPGKKLNLGKLKVDIEDSDPSSTYFAISDFNERFTAGKNAFSINGTKFLKASSPVLIEVVDSAGRSLYTEVGRFTSAVQYLDNQALVIAVHIDKNTAIGPGTVYIVSQLLLDKNNKKVPDNKNIVRWSHPIYIDPSLENTTKVRFYSKPQILVENLFSRIITYTTSSADTITDTGSCITVAEYPVKGFDYSLFNPFNQTLKYRIDRKAGPPFSSSFEGLEIVFSNIFLNTYPSSSFFDGTFTSTINTVINKDSLLLDTPFTTEDSNGASIINTMASAEYEINHYPTPELVNEADYFNLLPFIPSTGSVSNSQIFYKSIAAITLKNLKTFSGNVFRFRMYRRSQNSKIDSECIADELVQGKELIIDKTNPNRFKELMGVFYDQSHIENYWETSSTAITLVNNHDKLIDGLRILGSNDLSNGSAYAIVKDDSNIFYGNFDTNTQHYQFELFRTVDAKYYNYFNPAYDINNQTLYNTTQSQTANSGALQSNLNYLASNFIELFKDVPYEISANVIGTRVVSSTNKNLNGVLTFYLTGSKAGDISASLFELSPYYDRIGIPIMTASIGSGSGKSLGKVSSVFTLNEDFTGTVFISPSYGEYYISNVSLKPYEEKGYNAGVITIEVPFPVEISNENFSIRSELFDVNASQIPVTLETSQFFDTNGKTIIKPTYSINTISISSVSWDAVTNKPYLISSSLQFSSADTATFGNLTVTGLLNATVLNTISASYAKTASFALNSGGTNTGSFVITASGANNNLTASYAITAQFIQGGVATDYGTVITASNALTRESASYALTSSVSISSSYSNTSSFSISSSKSISSSFALTASFALNSGGTISTAGFVITASGALTNQTASYALTSSRSISSSFSITASYSVSSSKSISSSFACTSSYTFTIDDGIY